MFLLLISYILLGATTAGIFMVAALTAGYTTLTPILYSTLAGFVVAIPISWIVARKLRSLG